MPDEDSSVTRSALKAELGALEERLEKRMAALEERLENRMVSFEERLENRMVSFEERLESRMVSFEERVVAAMVRIASDSEARLEARIDEKIRASEERGQEFTRNIETNLLTAFEKYGKRSEARWTVSKIMAADAVTDIENLRQRVARLEDQAGLSPL